jgi:hypothetical protein
VSGIFIDKGRIDQKRVKNQAAVSTKTFDNRALAEDAGVDLKKFLDSSIVHKPFYINISIAHDGRATGSAIPGIAATWA